MRFFVPHKRKGPQGPVPAVVSSKLVVAHSPVYSEKWFVEELFFGPVGSYTEHPPESGFPLQTTTTVSVSEHGGGGAVGIPFKKARRLFNTS